MTIQISVTQTLAYLFTALALCGVGYLLLTIYAALRWMRTRHPVPAATPPISILKSLKGADRAMYEAFRSHALQDYPEFEVLFGVSDAADPAAAEVERLKQEFPHVAIRLVVCPERLGTNGKVSTLAQLLPKAKHGIVLINDSDITVAPDYLRKVAAEFADDNVGLVTALYRAEPGQTVASQIESVTIATDFAPGVLTARVVEGGIHFALGSTIAIRREVLEKIGGLLPLVDHLADDYELGARTSAAGYKVALADTVVETHLPSYGFGAMIEHQLRWARTVRDRRLGGYLGLIVTHAVPWAFFALFFSKFTMPSVLLWIAAMLLRHFQAWLFAIQVLDAGKYYRRSRERNMVNLRDFIALYVWIVSFFSNEVVWRGERFRVKDGKLYPAS